MKLKRVKNNQETCIGCIGSQSDIHCLDTSKQAEDQGLLSCGKYGKDNYIYVNGGKDDKNS